MELIQTRYDYSELATSGSIEGLQAPVYTVELPWNGNKDNDSCVPDGYYELVPYFSPKHKRWTWCLHNPELGIYAFDNMIPAEEKGRARAFIEIHPANYSWELLGCIGPGLGRGQAVNPHTGKTEPCVWNSGAAFSLIVQALAPDGDIEHAEGHALIINPQQGLLGTSGYEYVP